jgi:hypothetical protein
LLLRFLMISRLHKKKKKKKKVKEGKINNECL